MSAGEKARQPSHVYTSADFHTPALMPMKLTCVVFQHGDCLGMVNLEALLQGSSRVVVPLRRGVAHANSDQRVGWARFDSTRYGTSFRHTRASSGSI